MSDTSTPATIKPFVDPTKLGIAAAVQPLSGISHVDETFAVNGTGRGGYVRREETGKPVKAAGRS
jgi:hypothetical protein